jgi:hypothetical protein
MVLSHVRKSTPAADFSQNDPEISYRDFNVIIKNLMEVLPWLTKATTQ